jgi:hypothetical protein
MKYLPAFIIIILLLGGYRIPWAFSAPSNAVTNPGWETSVTDDWTDGLYGGSVRTNAQKHSGSWSAQLYSDNVHQHFSPALAVNSITSFTFYYAGFTGGNSNYILDVHYTDASEENYYVMFSADSAWHQLDITSALDAGKSIDKITFGGGSGNPVWYDDVELMYEEPNEAPTITSIEISGLSNNNIYCMKYYDFITIVNDADGASDITAISIRLAQGETVRWMVNATSLDGTPSFDIISGADVIDLNVAGCYFAELDNVGTLYLTIRQEWDAFVENDIELEVWVEDTEGNEEGWR